MAGVGGAAYGDSSDFILNTAYDMSADFVLDTTGLAGVGGSAYADSPDFILDTTGLAGVGGAAYADSADFILNTAYDMSADFTLDTTGLAGVGGLGYADSGDFVLNTTASSSYVWNGGTGDWFDPTQWTPQGVPGLSSEVSIAAGAVTLDTAQQIRTLHLSGGTLRGIGSLTVISQMDWLGGAMQDPGVTRLDANATLNLSGAAAKSLLGGRTLENFGLVTWSGGDLVALAACAIYNRPGGIFQITSYTTLAGSGTPPPVFYNEGLLVTTNVFGTNVFGLLLTNSGTVRLHSGLLACNAGFAPGGNSTLQIPLGGPTPHIGFGELHVSGNVALAGTLEIGFENGYQPVNNTTFTTLTYGSRSGSFSSILGLPQTCDILMTSNVGPTATTLTALVPGPCVTAAPAASAGKIELAWPVTFSHYRLRTTTNLLNGPWVEVPLAPGTHNATIPTDLQGSFYRIGPP